MKTAISIPDGVFEAAERASKRLGMSRSQLYTKAVEAYVDAHRTKGVREALDSVYSSQDSSVDPVLSILQRASLPRGSW